MMQALLADRFKLVVHRESQEANIFALTLVNDDGRLGPALHHSDVDCLALAAQARRGELRTWTQSKACELLREAGSLIIGGRPLAQLANSLSNIGGQTVVDETGLAGNFDVHLTWTAGRVAPPGSLLTALREHLGLELLLHKRSAEVLVVDRADRPVDR
jgi:uncharacterized protein (TIGR03435 family)